jgi:hypothetical protein
MEMDNGYGQTYHQMNWPPNDLFLVRDSLLDCYDPERMNDHDYAILNIIDRIEKELGVE